MVKIEKKIDTNAAAETGLAPGFLVAFEQNFPVDLRIIQDDLTARILPFYLRLFIGLARITAIRDWLVRAIDKQVRGIWSGLLCRKCYIRDKLTLSITEPNSFGAVVNLGAGYDALLYRLTALDNTPAWDSKRCLASRIKLSSCAFVDPHERQVSTRGVGIDVEGRRA